MTRPEGDALRQPAAWAETVAERVGEPWPDMPEGVADRAADVREPLLMLADLAGSDWPKLAREACTAFVTGARDDTQSVGTRLLADLRAVFGDASVMSTESILNALHGLDESPWADWYGHPLTPRDLAKLLKAYEVSSTKVRIGDDSVCGYRRDDLWDTWCRFLPGSGIPGKAERP